MTVNKALKIIEKYLVDTVDYEHMDTKQIFELGCALGTIEEYIMRQNKELILNAVNNENEVI